MSQDNKKSMVMYQGDGSNNVFAVPMTKGKYGTISVAFVRRGLDNYEYNPTTWTLNDENTLLTWTGDVLNVGDYIVIERTTVRKQPYEFPNNQKHIERSDDNLERQIQEVADAADRALKLDPTYSIDSDKMDPIEWLQTIVRCKDLTVRGLRFANNVLQYSKDDPEKPESEKTWYSLLNTDGITNVRVGTDTSYFEYSTDGGSNWKDVGEIIRHNGLQGRDEADCHPISAITGLQDKLDEKATASDTYTKTEVDEKLNLKADKATTLQGYGITDAYTKAETDNKLSEKLNTESAEETYATKTELYSHTENTDNPHNVTKAQVGLGNVDNTSDLSKPISTATQNALNGKLSIKQNPQDAGKVVKVGPDGNLEFSSESSGGGLLSVSHGATLKGAGTDSQPLDVADGSIGNTQLAEEVKQEIAGKQPAGNYATESDINTLESDINTLQGQIDYNSKDIEALQGAGGALAAYNFNTATPTQETLTKYAIDQIWVGNTNWAWNAANPAASTFTSADGVSRTAAEIFNSTWVNNTYDDHRWQLTNTQNTEPKVFEWVDVGRDIVSVATATTAGIVRVGDGSQMVVNASTGDISLDGSKAESIRGTIGAVATNQGTANAGKVMAVGVDGNLVPTPANCLPIGATVQYCGDNVPDNFMWCDGSEISRTTYASLFAVIGTKYGEGNGSTTFNLPNFNSAVPWGAPDWDAWQGLKSNTNVTLPYDGYLLATNGAQSNGIRIWCSGRQLMKFIPVTTTSAENSRTMLIPFRKGQTILVESNNLDGLNYYKLKPTVPTEKWIIRYR